MTIDPRLRLSSMQRRLVERIMAAQPGDKLYIVSTRVSDTTWMMGTGTTTALLVGLAQRKESSVVVSATGRSCEQRYNQLLHDDLLPPDACIWTAQGELMTLAGGRHIHFIAAGDERMRGISPAGLWMYPDAEDMALPVPHLQPLLAANPDAIQVAAGKYRGALDDARRAALEQDGWTIVDTRTLCK
jgi:hypothetical protein